MTVKVAPGRVWVAEIDVAGYTPAGITEDGKAMYYSDSGVMSTVHSRTYIDPTDTGYVRNQCNCKSVTTRCLCGCNTDFCAKHRASRDWLNEDHWYSYWYTKHPLSNKQWFDVPISGYELAEEVFDE